MNGLLSFLPWVTSALAGAVLSAALAPGASAALGFVAPALLLLALRGATGVLHAQALAFVAGASFWWFHVNWITSLAGVNPANLALGLGTLALVFSVFAVGVRLARAAPPGLRWAAIGASWVLAEYLRLHLGFASIPWGSLAYSQVDFAPLAQLAALAGIYGVSFVVVGFAAALADAIELAFRKRRPSGAEFQGLALPALLLVTAVAWGTARVEPPTDAALRVGFVQAGLYDRKVDARAKRSELLGRYREQSLAAVQEGAELVVWPASSVPGRMPFDTGLVRYLAVLARELERPLLVGSSGQDKSKPGSRERPTANSAFLLDTSGEIVERYDKVRLLPFNEYLPLRGLVAWPLWAGGGIMDAKAGEGRTVFTAAGARFSLLICWENFFPEDFREAAGQDVDFVVSMTNEAFAGEGRALHQMLTMNRFRAIEGGLPVVRAATTGISAVIDRTGRPIDAIEAGGVGFGVANLPLGGEPTPYVRFGDWLPGLCGLGLAGLLLGRSFRDRAAS